MLISTANQFYAKWSRKRNKRVEVGQTNIWELFVLLENSEEERPQEGWKIYENTPQGRKAVTTRRGKPVKFKNIRDMLQWVGENRRGYLISIDGYGYGGLLRPTKG